MVTTTAEADRPNLRGVPCVPRVSEDLGADLITGKDVALGFGISPNSMDNYLDKGLPIVYVGSRRALRRLVQFDVRKVKAWATKHNLTFNPPAK